MSAKIVRIETAGPGAKARRLVFDDNLDPRVTSPAAVRELGLLVGASANRGAVEDALRAIEFPLAKERALLLLGYREHSSAELVRKLGDCGYPGDVARAVADRLTEVELVDDGRFAHAWARSRLSCGYGPRRIRQELVQRGVDSALVDDALAEAVEAESEAALARKALRGRTPTDPRGRERLLRRLVGRGFSMSAALSALDSEMSAASFPDCGE